MLRRKLLTLFMVVLAASLNVTPIHAHYRTGVRHTLQKPLANNEQRQNLNPVNQQSMADLEQQVEQSLLGKRILITYRNGGPLHGTFYYVYVDFCSQNQFQLAGHSERRTILDNLEQRSWQDEGRYSVVQLQGKIGIKLSSISGEVQVISVDNPAIKIQLQGKAACR